MNIKRKDRLGEIISYKDGQTVQIISLHGKYNFTVRFNDGTIIENVQYNTLLCQRIKNRNKKTIFGVGYLGYGEYDTSKNRNAYSVWFKMLKRCYNPSEKEASYKDCFVCDEWHNFQNYAKWFYENYVKDFDVDKDLMFKGNKEYSPNKCCFVPRQINNLLVSKKAHRGKYPLGCCMDGNKLKVVVNIKGKCVNLGRFTDVEMGFEAYKKAKEYNIKQMANKYKHLLNEKCYNTLMSWTISIDD